MSLWQRLGGTRMATALIAAPPVLFVVWWGDWPFRVLVTLLALVALRELQVAVKGSASYGERGWRVWSGVGYLALLAALWLPTPNSVPLPLWAGTLAAVLLIGCVVFYGAREVANSPVSLGTVAITMLATSYVGLFALFVPLHELNGGRWFWLVLIAVWTSDSAAYYAGRAFGKRKLTSLSPGKTREGAVGGWIGALGAGAIVAAIAGLPILHGAILGAVVGLAAPLGDLAESFWKRELGVKDLGAIFPGHGGVLDRADSLLFAVLAAWIYLSVAGLGLETQRGTSTAPSSEAITSSARRPSISDSARISSR